MQQNRITLKLSPKSEELLKIAATIAKPSEGTVEMRRNSVKYFFMLIPLRITMITSTNVLKIVVQNDTDKPKRFVEKNKYPVAMGF